MNARKNPFPFQVCLLIALGVATCGLILWPAGAARIQADSKPVRANGIVTDSQNRPVAGAKVFFVDSAMVNTTSPLTIAGIVAGTTEGYDEPLEDIVNNPVVAKTLPQAVTSASGKFNVHGLKTTATYFAFVVPGTKDASHLPGGDLSRLAFSPNALTRAGIHIQVSWTPPSDATYIGTSACYTCHDKPNFAKHAHQVGLQSPGKLTANQSLAAHPSMGQFLAKFTPAAAYTDKGVEVLFFEDFDPTRNLDKFKVFEGATGGGKVYFKAFLWTVGGVYKVTLVNQLNAMDTPLTLNVKLTYGGALFRQVLLVDSPGRKGSYPFLQFQAFTDATSQGRNTYYDTTRKVFRDYSGATFFSPGPDGKYGTSDDVLTLPAPTATFEGQCAGCHYTGLTVTKDATTSELLASAVPDINGAYDSDGNGQPDEVNVGCESCHGPGSTHRTEALKGVTGKPGDKTNYKAKFIVNPALLCNDRASLICGRCHDQVRGNSSLGVLEVPLDANNQFPRPGISRATYLANNVSRKSFAATDVWQDGIHPKIHRAQYSTWIQAKHARNSRQLVACDDCHDAHADTNFRWFLVDDPDNPDSTLCQSCHALDVASHMLDKTGSVMTGSSQTCVSCHMQRTAKGGAGTPGLILGTPTGAATDANIVYWQNDISSHAMDVPTKFSAAGVSPGTAMPVPYTNSCGTCHNAKQLQYQQNSYGDSLQKSQLSRGANP